MRILATDIGGTHARAAFVEKRGPGGWDIGAVREIRTPRTAAGLLRWLKERAADAEGCALGIAGSIRDHRYARNSPNILFIRSTPMDLGGQITNALRKPCVVVNDMEAALAGEVSTGVLRSCRWAMMDTVSTGWGGALLLNGEIVAGEPGHTPSGLFENRECRLGQKDCNEAHFSGSQVEQRVRLILKQKKIPIPKNRSPNALAVEAVGAGEPWATELYRHVAEGIGRAWAYRLNLIPRIETIVYQGGFLIPAMELSLFRDTVRATIQAWTLFPDLQNKIPIERARAEHGALIGAAHIFLASRPPAAALAIR